jgi:hypothetical protein
MESTQVGTNSVLYPILKETRLMSKLKTMVKMLRALFALFLIADAVVLVESVSWYLGLPWFWLLFWSPVVAVLTVALLAGLVMAAIGFLAFASEERGILAGELGTWLRQRGKMAPREVVP